MLLALAAAGAAAQAPAPIRIGLIAPLTGGSADFGNSVRHGASMAVAEINAVGGYLGRPLELVLRDDKSNPEVGRAAAEDLVLKEKVAYTIGHCNTGVAMKALDVFETNKHLLMVPCSTGTLLTRKTPPAQVHQGGAVRGPPRLRRPTNAAPRSSPATRATPTNGPSAA